MRSLIYYWKIWGDEVRKGNNYGPLWTFYQNKGKGKALH